MRRPASRTLRAVARSIELPSCTQCGAVPRSRRQPHCHYCGAVLPWEIWDELSQHRLEVTRVEARDLEDALEEAGGAKGRAQHRSAARRRLRRLRRRMAHRDPNGGGGGGLDPTGALAIGAYIAIPAGLIFLQTASRDHFVAIFVGLLALALAAALWSQSAGRKERRRRSVRERIARNQGSRHVKSAVLAVSAPRVVPGTEATWKRAVTLFTAGRRQIVVLASDDLQLEAGDLGIASLFGTSLVSFERLGRRGEGVPVAPGSTL